MFQGIAFKSAPDTDIWVIEIKDNQDDNTGGLAGTYKSLNFRSVPLGGGNFLMRTKLTKDLELQVRT